MKYPTDREKDSLLYVMRCEESAPPMHGLQIWAHSYCRSTLAFYDALSRQFSVPLRICLAKPGLGIRRAAGFAEDEFSGLDIIDVSTDSNAPSMALDEHEEWHQIFGVYQTMPHIQRTIEEAIRRGCKTGIASEAPCNMSPLGFRRIVKNVYLRNIARARFAAVTSGSEFIINWSGDDAASLQAIGWRAKKIIPCGYFPPPLLGSKFIARDTGCLHPLHILCTGSMTWHRGPDILMRALVILKSWGICFQATFTGSGPLEARLRQMAEAHELECAFPGPVSMPELIELYQSCSLFVAPGRAEPWGMRVNDALNCGAPSIVSRGMGASKLILDYGFGATFAVGDPVDLAWQIRRSISAPDRYRAACDNLSRYRAEISPRAAACRVAGVLQHEFASWLDAARQ